MGEPSLLQPRMRHHSSGERNAVAGFYAVPVQRGEHEQYDWAWLGAALLSEWSKLPARSAAGNFLARLNTARGGRQLLDKVRSLISTRLQG